jgi:hypothetical protein
MTGATNGHVDAQHALQALDAALIDNSERISAMRERIAELLRHGEGNGGWAAAIAGGGRPTLLELLTDTGAALNLAGVGVRRALALSLFNEGVPVNTIATLFGVSHQRVSILLRDARRGAAAGVA